MLEKNDKEKKEDGEYLKEEKLDFHDISKGEYTSKPRGNEKENDTNICWIIT